MNAVLRGFLRGSLLVSLILPVVTPPAHADSATEQAAWLKRWREKHGQSSAPTTSAAASSAGQGSTVTALIKGEGIIVREGPGSDHVQVMMVDGGKRVPVLERQDGWAHVRFHSGKSGWVNEKFLVGLTEAPAPAAVATAPATRPAVAPPVASAPSSPVHPVVTAVPVASPVVPPVAVAVPAAPKPHAAKSTPPAGSGFLKDTKPDTAGSGETDRTQDNPVASIGDSWKMIAYLVPLLLLLVGGLRLVQRYQAQHGRLPSLLMALGAKNQQVSTPGRSRKGLTRTLLGSFNLNKARERGGGSIRVVESVPIGGANIHLIEVRGRMLLVGATANGVSVLTEFHENASMETDDFRSLLQAAAADMDSLGLATDELPTAAVVGSLDEVMRDTGDSLSRRVQRLRTVQEAEGDFS